MRPKATTRAARWADGVYSWSGNGNRDELAAQVSCVRDAWDAARRESKPILTAGFWYSLANDADARLKQYVYRYVSALGEDIARGLSKTMDRSSPDAVCEALDGYEELGVDECLLNSATADFAEVDNLLEVLAKRG